MNIFIPLLVLLLIGRVIPAECRSVTWYSDGAFIELEATATKGTLEIPLPATMIEGSLRVKPLGGSAIQRLDILPAATDTGKDEKELDVLLEQRSRLGDRMQALTTREEIFKSAAKSQSGKAPRKTKTNPDPMKAIRQGTDFAIAELEAVYSSRRRTEQEIRRLEIRIAAARRSERRAGTVARIHLSPVRGTVLVRYAVANQGWTPRYDIHLDDSHTAQLFLSALTDGSFAGYLLQVSPAVLAERDTARVFTLQAGPTARIAGFRLPVSEVNFGSGILSSFSFIVKNSEPVYLPGGNASLYRNGEYIGGFRFEGISSGRSRTIRVGR
jgi:hypothetical protein